MSKRETKPEKNKWANDLTSSPNKQESHSVSLAPVGGGGEQIPRPRKAVNAAKTPN